MSLLMIFGYVMASLLGLFVLIRLLRRKRRRWWLLFNEAELHWAEGRLQEAERCFRDAVDLARAIKPQSLRTAQSYSGLGSFLHERCRFQEARANLEKSLEIEQQILGEENPVSAITFNDIGMVYHDEGRYEDAMECLQRSLEMKEKIYSNFPMAEDASNFDIAITLNNLAGTHLSRGEHEEAEALYSRALALQTTSGGPPPDLARAFNDLGYPQMLQGKYEQAEVNLRQALDIYRSIYPELGWGPPRDISSPLTNLGELCRRQGRYEEAEDYLLQALEIDRKGLGEDDPEVCKDLENLAAVQVSQGRHDLAVKRYEEALAILLAAVEKLRTAGRDAEAKHLESHAGALREKLEEAKEHVEGLDS